MELQVMVAGKPRDVCGVDDKTTADEVVYVLKETLKLRGSYCLVAYWRKNEIVFSPSESPLNLINRVGDHPKQFKFILRQTNQASDVSLKARSPIPSKPSYRIPTNSSLHTATTNYNLPHERNSRQQADKEVAAALSRRPVAAGVDISTTQLSQLSTVDWNRRLQEEYQKQKDLLAEQKELQINLQRLDSELSLKRNQVKNLEGDMASQLTNLLNMVEASVAEKRAVEASLLGPENRGSAASFRPPSNRATPTVDGVMI